MLQHIKMQLCIRKLQPYPVYFFKAEPLLQLPHSTIMSLNRCDTAVTSVQKDHAAGCVCSCMKEITLVIKLPIREALTLDYFCPFGHTHLALSSLLQC